MDERIRISKNVVLDKVLKFLIVPRKETFIIRYLIYFFLGMFLISGYLFKGWETSTNLGLFNYLFNFVFLGIAVGAFLISSGSKNLDSQSHHKNEFFFAGLFSIVSSLFLLFSISFSNKFIGYFFVDFSSFLGFLLSSIFLSLLFGSFIHLILISAYEMVKYFSK